MHLSCLPIGNFINRSRLEMTPHYVDSKIMIYKIKCGPYDNNAYLLVCQQTGESLIIDTPSDPEELISIASTTQVKGVLITHNHMDHLLGFDEVTSVFDVPIGIGTDDASALKEDAALLLEDDTKIDVGNISVTIISTPGHTPGSICIIYDHHLFTGDTLFPGGPGKTQSPDNLDLIIESITSKLFSLPSGVAFYPGHGDDGLLDESRREYAVFSSKERPRDMFGDVEWLKH